MASRERIETIDILLTEDAEGWGPRKLKLNCEKNTKLNCENTKMNCAYRP
jgi:hypothetical protein